MRNYSALLSIFLVVIAQFLLLHGMRQLGQFPYLLFAVLIFASLVYGFSLRKIEKDDEIKIAFPKEILLKFSNLSLVLFISAIAILVLFMSLYAASGYSHLILVGWIFSIVMALAALWQMRSKILKHPYTKLDLKIVGVLLVLFAPLYLLFLYKIPFQINTDEITISRFAKILIENPSTDILGASFYLGFPSLIFVIWGHLANLLGGITLENVRLLHATSGLLVVGFSYFFFRLFFKIPQALAATVILGSSHALVAISRMAMRDNTSLLLEVIAMIFLFRGIITKCPLKIFIGGLISGLTFYTYFPSRATPILWFLFLGLAYIYLVHKVKISTVIKIAAISLIGFLMAASPIIIATAKNKSGLAYSKETTLFTKEGRQLAQNWAFANDTKTAVKENIARGLLTFNSNQSDEGWIYPNINHGFVDPVSGILVWLGFGFILFKKRKDLEDILMAGSFIFLLLAFAFILNKAPSYTRLLVILPFSTFLILEGITTISRQFGKFKNIVLATLTVLIVVLNLKIFADFVQKGLQEGNDVGGIGRYTQEKAAAKPNHMFILVADKTYPIYSWGEPNMWQTWTAFFAPQENKVLVLNPQTFQSEMLPISNYSIILNGKLFREKKENLISQNPNLKIHNLKPNGSILAIEAD